MNYSDEKIALIFLNMVPRLGPRRCEDLVHACGSAQKALRASVDDIASVIGIPDAVPVRAFLNNGAYIDDEVAYMREHGVRAVLYDEPEYPDLLSHIVSPPPVLYCRGTGVPKERYAVSLVGTRRPTHYGRETARLIVDGLMRHDIITVSGGARGIDTEVHVQTLKNRGYTVAVMGCGLGVTYPPENKKLFERIAENGICISEFSCKTRPDKMNFPRRNRIIAGFSRATVVIEAGLKSGALITARFAAEQGRDVLAVPGSAHNALSHGNHWLLRQGARPVLSAEDIMEDIFPFELRGAGKARRKDEHVPLNDEEQRIFSSIGWEPTPLDTVLQKTQMNIGTAMQVLLCLQMKGCIEELPGKNFICCMKGIKNA